MKIVESTKPVETAKFSSILKKARYLCVYKQKMHKTKELHTKL